MFIGVPLAVDGELYNVAAALNRGNILGFTTKTFLPNYGEFYEMRQFRPGPEMARWITLDGKENSIRATAPICGRTDGGTGRFGRDL